MKLTFRGVLNAVRILAVFSLVAVALFALSSPAHAATVADGVRWLLSPNDGLPAGTLGAMIIIPWEPALTRADLDLMSNPIAANQPEVVPWQLYDTQNITTAVATPLVFFGGQNNDKTLSNMEGPGQLTDPQYFIVHYLAADFLQAPAATALANEPNSALANVENVLKTVRATFTFSMSNKQYGPFSLTMAHGTGGASFSGYGYGTAANGTSAGVVNNGIVGSGGFPFSGAVVIPPKVGFNVTVNFSAAPTIVAGPLPLRLSLIGALYRRVL